MANNFQRGDLLFVTWAPLGGSSNILNITGWNLDDFLALYDVTHTGLNGAGTGRIAGKGDSKASVQLDYDADASPYLNAPNIQKGVSGVAQFLIKPPNRFIQIPMIIERVKWETSRDSWLKFGVDLSENVFVGTRVYPPQ